MSIKSFYAKSRWRDTWHKRRIVKGIVSVHSGLDVGAAARATVPALAGGTVTRVARVTDIGWYVEIRVSKTEYHVYCHVLPRVEVGDVVRAGETVAVIAGANDFHGTLWTGAHLHFMVARVSGSAHNRSITIDPAPYVLAALRSGGGSSGASTTTNRGDDDMRLIKDTEPADPNKPYYLVGEHTFSGRLPYSEATRFAAIYGTAVHVSHKAALFLKQTALENRATLIADQAKAIAVAVGADPAAAVREALAEVTPQLEAIRAELATIGDVDEAALAQAVVAGVADDVATMLDEHLDEMVDGIKATVPQATIDLLVKRLAA